MANAKKQGDIDSVAVCSSRRQRSTLKHKAKEAASGSGRCKRRSFFLLKLIQLPRCPAPVAKVDLLPAGEGDIR